MLPSNSTNPSSLSTDHADVYLMHRDNPDVPVGEFVDAIDEQVSAGRINLSASPTGRASASMPRSPMLEKSDRAKGRPPSPTISASPRW